MDTCQLIDLVDMDNPWHLRTWRRVEMWSAPLMDTVDSRLPRDLVKRRKKVVGRLKGWLGKVVKPVPRGAGQTPASGSGTEASARNGARSGPGQSQGAGAVGPRDDSPRLQPGDLVRVKSFEAVQQTLNRRGMCGGLRFMPVQRAFCGKTLRVLKQVNTFLDERDFRVKRLRRVVILEGAYCDGSPLEPEGCDRMCFLFWKEAWLEKVG